jgi:hypothetical protein
VVHDRGGDEQGRIQRRALEAVTKSGQPRLELRTRRGLRDGTGGHYLRS